MSATSWDITTEGDAARRIATAIHHCGTGATPADLSDDARRAHCPACGATLLLLNMGIAFGAMMPTEYRISVNLSEV